MTALKSIIPTLLHRLFGFGLIFVFVFETTLKEFHFTTSNFHISDFLLILNSPNDIYSVLGIKGNSEAI